MANIYLIAKKIDSLPEGHQYTLSVGPGPVLGLSQTPPSKHWYATLDDLCAVITDCEAFADLDVAALRVHLGKGESYAGLIDEESAACMGFTL